MKNENIEIWKNIKGFEDHYQISTQGNVRSKDRFVRFNDGRLRFYKGGLKKQCFNKKRGYHYVSFKVEQKTKTFSIHRLVAETFIPNKSKNMVVDHKDKDKTNNKLSNLRWVTNRFNLSRNSIDEKGYVGICWHKRNNKWMASIYLDGKIKHLGYFINREDAENEYLKHLDNV